jgi:hypothetical protein
MVPSSRLAKAKRRNDRIQLRKVLPAELTRLGLEPNARLSQDFEEELRFSTALELAVSRRSGSASPGWVRVDGLNRVEFLQLVARLGRVWAFQLVRVVLGHWVPAGYLSMRGREFARFALPLLEFDGDTILAGTADIDRFCLLDLYEERSWLYELRVDRATAADLGIVE